MCPSDDYDSPAALARAELQSARSRLCPAHGVAPAYCRSVHATETDPTPEEATA